MCVVLSAYHFLSSSSSSSPPPRLLRPRHAARLESRPNRCVSSSILSRSTLPFLAVPRLAAATLTDESLALRAQESRIAPSATVRAAEGLSSAWWLIGLTCYPYQRTTVHPHPPPSMLHLTLQKPASHAQRSHAQHPPVRCSRVKIGSRIAGA